MNIIKSYISRKTSYYRNYYYKNAFFTYNFKEEYLRINSYETYKTQTSIIFRGKVFFGMTIKEVESILGKTNFKAEYEKINNYITIYYKNKIKGLKNKLQLHFYNQIFFFGVQHFLYLSKQEKNDLFDLVKIKYQIPLSSTLPIAVKDHDNNILVVRDNMGLLLEYYSGDKVLIKNILEAFEHEEQKTILKQEETRRYIMNSI